MYKLLICVRYLRTRYIALASIISVMLGVATMIVVNSVLAGFTNEMRDRIHGFLADVLIESRHMEGMEDSEQLLAEVQEAIGEYAVAMTPTVEIPAMAQIEFGTESYPKQIGLVGIRPDSKAEVGSLQDCLASYQPQEVNGEKLAPLRSGDVPINWELTPDAMERRRLVKQNEREWLRRKQMLDYGEDRPGLPVFDDVSDVTSESGTEGFAQSEPEFEDTATTPIPDVADAISGSAETDGLLGRRMEASPFELDETSAETDDGPLPARAFVGRDLVSYLANDQTTGEKHRVWLARPGDDITITTAKVGMTGKPDTVSFNVTIVDIFNSGMSEYDGKLVLMNIEELQKQRGMLYYDRNGEVIDSKITSVQIKLKNYDDAASVIGALSTIIPPHMAQIETWESKQGMLLSAVEMETAILNVLLFLIITVAGFGILAIFYMIVVEKTRDIGILKSLGASSRGIMTIFLSYGLGLGMVGAVAGVTIGLVFVRYINEIEETLSWVTGRKVFDRDIYYFDSIPTHVSPLMVLWVAAGAMAIAVLASVLPARRASRLHPVRALRFD